MTSPSKVLKSVGPKLVPFFKTLAVYFVIFIPADEPSVLAAVLKVLPVLSLIAFVLLHGISLGDEYSYSRRVLAGLVFSVFGDIFLVWSDYFLHGIFTFLLAQICYISAFGFKPFNLPVFATAFSFCFVGLSTIIPNTEGPIKIGILIYGVVLTSMLWRAISRVQFLSEIYTWTKLCSCIGGVLFAISDLCIGINAFFSPIPYSQAIIMSTYYAAQLGISLSVVDCKASYEQLQNIKNAQMQIQEEETVKKEGNLRKRVKAL